MNISKLPLDYSCDILSKNVATFHPGPKNLPEDKFKFFGLGL